MAFKCFDDLSICNDYQTLNVTTMEFCIKLIDYLTKWSTINVIGSMFQTIYQLIIISHQICHNSMNAFYCDYSISDFPIQCKENTILP